MKSIDIAPYVQSLGIRLPPIDRFWTLGDLTGLRRDAEGRFYRANYERGILMYALVAKCRPSTVLEFGTGRGYGCLCMAWAMKDYNIDGQIYTVDMTAPHQGFTWEIDWGLGAGARVENLARAIVWPKAAPAGWLTHIEELTGFAGQVMKRYQGPKVDLAFIDGGHGYEAVRHDYYSTLEVASKNLSILFDDYAPVPGFGVQKLIDEEVTPHFDATLVFTDRRWPGGERASIAHPEYGMVWARDLTQLTMSRDAHQQRVRTLRAYRQKEKLMRVRRYLGKIWHGR